MKDDERKEARIFAAEHTKKTLAFVTLANEMFGKNRKNLTPKEHEILNKTMKRLYSDKPTRL